MRPKLGEKSRLGMKVLSPTFEIASPLDAASGVGEESRPWCAPDAAESPRD
jgi:hypothetical protein